MEAQNKLLNYEIYFFFLADATYTPCPEKGATLCLTKTLASFGVFL